MNSPYTAVLDKVSRPEAAPTHAMPAVARHSETRTMFADLIARVLGSSEPVRSIVFLSALPREGVTWTLHRAAAEIERTAGLHCSVVDAADILTSAEISVLGAATTEKPEPVSRLTALRARCDLVLIDGGALSGGGSGLAAMRLADAAVLVVEAGRTTCEEVEGAIGTIGAAGGNLMGLVLNKKRYHMPRWIQRLLA